MANGGKNWYKERDASRSSSRPRMCGAPPRQAPSAQRQHVAPHAAQQQLAPYGAQQQQGAAAGGGVVWAEQHGEVTQRVRVCQEFDVSQPTKWLQPVGVASGGHGQAAVQHAHVGAQAVMAAAPVHATAAGGAYPQAPLQLMAGVAPEMAFAAQPQPAMQQQVYAMMPQQAAPAQVAMMMPQQAAPQQIAMMMPQQQAAPQQVAMMMPQQAAPQQVAMMMPQQAEPPQMAMMMPQLASPAPVAMMQPFPADAMGGFGGGFGAGHVSPFDQTGGNLPLDGQMVGAHQFGGAFALPSPGMGGMLAADGVSADGGFHAGGPGQITPMGAGFVTVDQYVTVNQPALVY